MPAVSLVRVAVLSLAWLWASRGEAQPAGELPDDPRARELLEEGLAAYEARDYERATDAFQRGHAIEGRRVFLFSWAQAERLSGRCDRASPLYRRFLDEGPPAEQAARAREGLARCAADQPEGQVNAPPAPPRPRPARPRPFWTDPLGDVLAGAGLAAFLTATVLLVAGEAAANDAGEAGSLTEWRDAADAADGRRLWAGVSAVVGVGLAVAAVVRFATRAPVETTAGTAGTNVVVARWAP